MKFFIYITWPFHSARWFLWMSLSFDILSINQYKCFFLHELPQNGFVLALDTWGLRISYLVKPGTSLNDPKPAKTSLNLAKTAETTQKICEATQNNPKLQNWGNL